MTGKRFFTLILLMAVIMPGLAAEVLPKAKAVRTEQSIHIDGILEERWQTAEPITQFTQYEPVFSAIPSQRTEVRLLYDDHFLYVGARMYDSSPDSILRQLGNRDDDPNADYFAVSFDTYNSRLDAWEFRVYASGVQKDFRHQDGAYNGVWQSAVSIDSDGWCLEMAIPYSALRFPNRPEQVWAMQLVRSIRRHREFNHWSLEQQGTNNRKNHWGLLHGITGVTPPLRLSMSPYFSAGVQHYPHNLPAKSNYSFAYGGGADLKYGINGSYTLDVTLLPDFSAVQSDNRVKNLSAFEVTYSEQRPFFYEATELFGKGGLFYSRRIGRIPQKYYGVQGMLKTGEVLTYNPYQAPLINAIKLSGRGSNGLAVGVLNALTANTYAEVSDSTGNSRRILTEPLSNYSIMVLDQTLRNNGNIYLINTNVSRAGDWSDANVTGAGIRLMDKTKSYFVRTAGNFSHIAYGNQDPRSGIRNGYRYEAEAGKASGRLQYRLHRYVSEKNYDINHMGVSHRNDEAQHQLTLSWSVFNPWWKLRNLNSEIYLFNRMQHSTSRSLVFEAGNNLYVTTLRYLSIWNTFKFGLTEETDLYEARSPGRVYIYPRYSYSHLGFSSDYRKPFALDGQFGGWINTDNGSERNFWIRPIIRLGNRISMNFRWQHIETNGQKGFAAIAGDSIVFGRRTIRIDESTLNFKYLFRNNLSLNLRLRHYWNRGIYNAFYRLNEAGRLEGLSGYQENHDYDYNSLNIDMVFNWEFAPGSNLSIVWKNDLLQEKLPGDELFFQKLGHSLDAPQLNTITVKLLYYLDYQMLSRKKQSG